MLRKKSKKVEEGDTTKVIRRNQSMTDMPLTHKYSTSDQLRIRMKKALQDNHEHNLYSVMFELVQLFYSDPKLNANIQKALYKLHNYDSQLEQLNLQKAELQKQVDLLTKDREELLKQQTTHSKEELIQSQFEAIQRLLQREHLTKVFLKRVGDSSVIKLYEDFISKAEDSNSQDEDCGNLHAQVNNIKDPQQIVKKLQKPYKKRVNLSDSLYADDSSTEFPFHPS